MINTPTKYIILYNSTQTYNVYVHIHVPWGISFDPGATSVLVSQEALCPAQWGSGARSAAAAAGGGAGWGVLFLGVDSGLSSSL